MLVMLVSMRCVYCCGECFQNLPRWHGQGRNLGQIDRECLAWRRSSRRQRSALRLCREVCAYLLSRLLLLHPGPLGQDRWVEVVERRMTWMSLKTLHLHVLWALDLADQGAHFSQEQSFRWDRIQLAGHFPEPSGCSMLSEQTWQARPSNVSTRNGAGLSAWSVIWMRSLTSRA